MFLEIVLTARHKYLLNVKRILVRVRYNQGGPLQVTISHISEHFKGDLPLKHATVNY